jgi:glycosyltransferase involved in cell wall biosynthesis
MHNRVYNDSKNTDQKKAAIPTSPRMTHSACPEISIVMPCLNEVKTLGHCISEAKDFLDEAGLCGEIIVADNGSSDGSQALAVQLGAKVVSISKRGYGCALRGGIDAARGHYIIMGDSDASYNFRDLAPFVTKLKEGADLVMGNRFQGGIAKGAMPPLHRYIGNPLLSLLARVLFKVPCGDIYCGLRAFSKNAVTRLNLQSDGMEFALEMVVKAQLLKMRIAEVPTTLTPDGRSRAPHLNTWKDGIRSLRFYFFCSSNRIFLYPGLAITLISLALGSLLIFGPLQLGSIELSIHTLVYCGFGVLIGIEAMTFSICAQALATELRLIPVQSWLIRIMEMFHSGIALLISILLIGIGVGLFFHLIIIWQQASFSHLNPFEFMRLVVPSAVILGCGFQTVFLTLYLSLVKFQFWRNLSLLKRETVDDRRNLPFLLTNHDENLSH